MQPSAFITMIAPAAAEFQRSGGPFASITIAQAILETGYGARLPVDERTGQQSYNLFGIKGTGPAGTVYTTTHEVYHGRDEEIKDYFAAYHNFAESLEGHYQFLLHGYDPVLHAATPEAACQALQSCGYATDPLYAEKLIDLIHQYNLHQYDTEADDMQPQDKAKLDNTAATLMDLVKEVHKLEEHSGVLATPPDYAAATIDKLVARGVLHDRTGTETFYRVMTVLDRLGKLD